MLRGWLDLPAFFRSRRMRTERGMSLGAGLDPQTVRDEARGAPRTAWTGYHRPSTTSFLLPSPCPFDQDSAGTFRGLAR